ncbi:MAG TPA: hypothetical protein VJ992_00560 [Gemmatimonadales bacterium]|nr:hypothetical protein [Gemmatimonadales bacterium]
MSRRIAWLVLAAVSAAPASLPGQVPSRWRPDERAILQDFSYVTAVAASDQRVFVATPNGLGLYDRSFHRWDPPVTVSDGYPQQPVVAALADPSDESVWLATSIGVVHYEPFIRRFDVVPVAGGVQDLMINRDDPFSGIYLRTGSGWQKLPRGGFIPSPAGRLPPPNRQLRPLSPAALVQRLPFLQGLSATILIDRRMRSYQYTSAAAVPNTNEFFVGTNGLGVLRVDELTAQVERMPFGLLANAVGAVVAAPGGVWAATGAYSARDGFTFVSTDLQQYAYDEGPRATGFGFHAVRALLFRGSTLWAATDNGLIRTNGHGDSRRFTTADHLPGDAVLSLASGTTGLWVGTRYGLAYVSDLGNKPTIANVDPSLSAPVAALASFGDSVWIGSAVGLGIAAVGGRAVVPPDVAAVPYLKDPIAAIALHADTVIVATENRILWRARADTGAAWHVGLVLSPQTGPIVAIAPERGGVWVGGDQGLVYFGFRTNALRRYTIPMDLPGPVRGLAVDGEYLWIATERGLVRFSRRALLP